jgi:hypothetical protein
MPHDLETYRQMLLDLYLRLPDTPRRLSRYDVRLVRQLWERQIPLTLVETAFLLASTRRATRRPDAKPLGPIRSALLPARQFVTGELEKAAQVSEEKIASYPFQGFLAATGTHGLYPSTLKRPQTS